MFVYHHLSDLPTVLDNFRRIQPNGFNDLSSAIAV
jgi:hypothetical protein